MSESLSTRLMRFRFNLFPAYRGTGARITYIDRSWREVRIRLPLNWRTRNYVGTTFGGSMYGAVDPILMVMLIRNLGPGYTVWDKAATIRFRAPGRSALFARFLLSGEELDTIRATLQSQPSVDRVYTVELSGADGTVHATVDKTIHVERRSDAAAVD
jgi:acyl-coenzyme A thioesterase PaaI-like protein